VDEASIRRLNGEDKITTGSEQHNISKREGMPRDLDLEEGRLFDLSLLQVAGSRCQNFGSRYKSVSSVETVLSPSSA